MRELTTRRKAAFALVTIASLVLLAEGALWLGGAPTLLERADPYRGFSERVPVFAKDGDRYRTARQDGPRTFNEQSFLVDKPARGLRIFCLGGSSAYGYPWGADVAFTAILGDALARELPGRTVEAINSAGISYASHRLRIVANEVFGYEPDVLIVYGGHNEFVEEQFRAELQQAGAALRDADAFLGGSRLYGLLQSLGAGRRREAQLSGFRAFVRREQTTAYTQDAKERVVAQARRSFRVIIRQAVERGIKVAVCTVPCNLSDWSPNASIAPRGLTRAQLGSWRAALEAGRELVAKGDGARAAKRLREALDVAPGHAESHYLLGQAQALESSWDAARSSFQAACDLDASPIRRLSSINDALRDIAAEEGALLVDVDRAFEERSEHGLVGSNLIEDYVHPTREGHALIAWQLLRALADAGWLPGLQAPSEARFRQSIADSAPKSEVRSSTWLFNQGYLLEHRGRTSQAIDMYRQALDASPTHSGALANISHLLTKAGRASQALGFSQQLLRQDPDNPQGQLAQANALARLGRLEQAEVHYRKAVALAPQLVSAWVNLGLVLLRRGDDVAAAAALDQALAHDPSRFVAHLELGAIHARAQRYEVAAKHYRAALEVNPRSEVATCRLGLALLALGQSDRGRALLELARELAPKPIDPASEVGSVLRELGFEY